MRHFLLVILSFVVQIGQSQDVEEVRRLMDTLCAPRYDGRGYVNQGDVRAANFLARECDRLGLVALVDDYHQPFTLGVNTFPGNMIVELNRSRLEPGADFIINPNSSILKGNFKTRYVKDSWLDDPTKLQKKIDKGYFNGRIVIVDLPDEKKRAKFIQSLPENPLKAEGYIHVTDQKLTWSVGRRMLSTSILQVDRSALDKKVKSVAADIDQQWVSEYETKNVVAALPGEVDSMVVFTAHYDHLGRMGSETYIPGASDNASGTAMLLDLAAYYKENPSHYTTIFIWFAGEEAGLVGSKYFVENPPFNMDYIKFLLNLDLMADAGTGVTAVNGKVFEEDFARLSAINEEHELLDKIKARGEAANSDHHPFYLKGVPCFFLYTMGEYKHYHDIYDKPSNVEMVNYDQVFELVTRFVDDL